MATKKLIIAAVVAAGLLILALAVVLTTDFDSPELGRLALGRVGQASGFELTARGFRLNLLRGLELEGVEARAVDGGLSASLERLVLKHRPADLLGGTLTVTEVRIEGPRMELDAVGDGAADGSQAGEPTPAQPASKPADDGADKADESANTSLDLAISSIRLVDGSLRQRDATGAITELRGIEAEVADLRLDSDPSAGEPAAEGRIRIDEVELSDGVETTTIRGVEIDLDALALDRGLSLAGSSLAGVARFAEVITASGQETTTQAKDVRGRLELAGGRFRLEDIEMSTPQGDLRGEFTADVAAEPLTYSLDLHGDALSTGVLFGIGDLRGLGTTRFEFQASGRGTDPERLTGNGRLTVNGGELPDHPILTRAEQLLGNVALVGAGYQAFPLEFDLRDYRIHLAPAELTAGPVSLTVSGWVDLEGPLELELTALTPGEGLMIKEIPAEVLEVLTEDDGRVNLPLLVTGTADASSVALNQAYLEQLARRYVRGRVEDELGKALGRLFGDH